MRSKLSTSRVAVITGAGRGIGRATAAALAADGYRVILADLRFDEDARQIAKSSGGDAVECDVTEPASVRELAAGIDSLDLLVNNAGVWQFSSLADTDVEHYRRVMDVNVLGNLLCTQHLAPIIVAGGGGSIVNVTSFLAEVPRANSGIYPATKAAIIALTKQAAVEYAEVGIRVNAVAPGLVYHDGAAALFPADPAERARRGGFLPLGRLAEPADIAGVVAFLASDAARYITGQTLYADGGISVGTMRFLHRAWDN